MLYSSAVADELNEFVRTRVAGHLFVCCNYEPCVPGALHADGKYFLGIENLYRLYFDCSSVLGRMTFMKQLLDEASLEEYRRLRETIQMLRGCLAHNNSQNNGRRQEKRLAAYRLWVRRVAQKPLPENEADFQLMVDELARIGGRMRQLALQAIECIALAAPPQRAAWIEMWEQATIQWYCRKGVKQEIFLGELENLYVACAGRADLLRGDGDQQLNWCITDWCRRFCECYRDQLEGALGWLEGRPGGDTARQKLQRQLSCVRAADRQYESSRDAFAYQNCLFALLEEMLPDTLRETGCTMLPEDLLQRQIDALFNICMP